MENLKARKKVLNRPKNKRVSTNRPRNLKKNILTLGIGPPMSTKLTSNFSNNTRISWLPQWWKKHRKYLNKWVNWLGQEHLVNVEAITKNLILMLLEEKMVKDFQEQKEVELVEKRRILSVKYLRPVSISFYCFRRDKYLSILV